MKKSKSLYVRLSPKTLEKLEQLSEIAEEPKSVVIRSLIREKHEMLPATATFGVKK